MQRGAGEIYDKAPSHDTGHGRDWRATGTDTTKYLKQVHYLRAREPPSDSREGGEARSSVQRGAGEFSAFNLNSGAQTTVRGTNGAQTPNTNAPVVHGDKEKPELTRQSGSTTRGTRLTSQNPMRDQEGAMT